jgi:hypothetical protein
MAEGMNLTAEQLQTLITSAVTAAVSESRKPAPLTDAQEAEILQANDMRLQQRDLVLQGEANKRALQAACSHMRRDNTCSCVYVASGNYIIDQQCQAIIRPGTAPEGYAGNDIYDTQLFNRLFQMSESAATF